MKLKRILIVLLIVLALAVFAVGCQDAKAVEYIELQKLPQLEYVQGQAFQLDGALLYVRYKDGSETTFPLDLSMISGFNPDQLGKQILTISYEGATSSVTVNVVAPSVKSATVEYTDRNTTYIQEQNLNLDGVVLKIEFNNGTSTSVPVTSDMISGDYNMDIPGSYTVEVSYTLTGGQKLTGSFPITVAAKTLTGIEIDTAPTKKVYYVGETIDLTGGVLFLAYDNGYPVRVEMNALGGDLKVSWDNTKESSSVVVTLDYYGKIAKFTVQVLTRDVAEVAYDTPPQQIEGLSLNLNGFGMTITYNNGTEAKLLFRDGNIVYQEDGKLEAVYTPEMQNQPVRFENYDPDRTGTQTVTMRFYYISGANVAEMATTFDIDLIVEPKMYIDVEILMPDGMTIYQDKAFDLTGWQYVLHYDNDTRSEPRPLTANMINPDRPPQESFVYDTAGTETWRIVYGEVESFFEFNVVANTVVKVTPVNDNFFVFYTFAPEIPDGLSFRIDYANGTQKTLAADEIRNLPIASYDQNLGSGHITFAYSDKYVADYPLTAAINVIRKLDSDTGLGMVAEPELRYNPGSVFTGSGMEIAVTYIEMHDGIERKIVETVSEFGEGWSFVADWAEEGVCRFPALADGELSRDFPIYVTYAGLADPDKQGVGLDVVIRKAPQSIALINTDLGIVPMHGKIDLNGLFIEVYYDGVDEPERIALTEDMLDYDPKADVELGLLAVTITYRTALGDYATEDGLPPEFRTTVTVVAPEAVELKITAMPLKTQYVYGVDTQLDLSGMEVCLQYDNNVLKTVDLDLLQYTSIEGLGVGEQQITINYADADLGVSVSCFLTITVIESPVESMQWKGGSVPEAEISEGVDFDLYGNAVLVDDRPVSELPVSVKYAGDASATETTLGSLQFRAEGFVQGSATLQIVKLYYSDRAYLELRVRIVPREIESVELDASTPPFSVIEGMPLDLSRATLILNYNNFTKGSVSLQQSNVVISEQNPGGYNAQDPSVGERSFTIRYVDESGNEFFTTAYVTVQPKQLLNIEVATFPKTQYIEGDVFSVEGGTVTLYYNNDTTVTLSMEDALLNNVGTFYITNYRFDTSEFSGFSKSQTIYIFYVEGGVTYETRYSVIVKDRKDPVVVMDNANLYTFMYGDTKAPKWTVQAYSTFDAAMPDTVLPADRVLVQYVPVGEINNMDPAKDYTVLPTEVGRYYIRISYNSDAYGDRIHNSFVNTDFEIVINTRTIYVKIDAVSKIYGTANPDYRIVAMSPDKYHDPSIVDDKPFAYDEDFFSPAFADQNVDFGTVCYDDKGRPVRIFRIGTFISTNGNPVDIVERTAAGVYTLKISDAVSKNYNIIYVDTTFTVVRRQVAVIPDNVQVEYGTPTIYLTYATAPIDGIADSGLLDGDKFNGNLSRASGRNVGTYRINRGDLSNPNYEIVLDTEAKYLTIAQRNIYIKVDNIDKIYGEEVVMPTIAYFRDNACLDPDAFAYPEESENPEATLGAISFVHGVNRLSDVDVYPVSVSVNPEGTLGNYRIFVIEGNLSILARPIAVSADALSKYYGDSDPALTFRVSGVEGIDASGPITGEDGQLQTLNGALVRRAGENVGVYPVTDGTLKTENPNYDIRFASSIFTIEQKQLWIGVRQSDLTKIYDGKTPALAAYSVWTSDKEGALIPFEGETAFVTVAFQDASRNVGNYAVSFGSTNPNYSVASYADYPGGEDTAYVYSITQRIVEQIDYIDLPDNQAYNAQPFAFSAAVPQTFVQYEYNPDGSIKTDENNNPVRDQIHVYLNLNSVTDAGTYLVRVDRLDNANYRLASSFETQITIRQRELEIQLLKADPDDPNTMVVEYTGKPAQITANDFVIVGGIEGINVNLALSVVNPVEGSTTAPQNVRYDEEGNIISYEIVAGTIANPNFVLTKTQGYRYKIVPCDVKIEIYSVGLSKSYDGKAPEIEENNFNFTFTSVNKTNLAKSAVEFVFTRTVQDDRPNGDVGEYSVSIVCDDRNHNVSLKETYVYRINAISVTVRTSNASKQYDGKQAGFRIEDLVLSNTTGYKPIVRNFAATETQSVTEVYNQFHEQLLAVIESVRTIGTPIANLIVTDVASIPSRVSEIKKYTSAALLMLQDNQAILQADLYSETVEMLALVTSYADDLEANRNNEKAEQYLALMQESYQKALTAIKTEDTFIAFLFEPAVGSSNSNVQATNSGNYRYRIVYSDNNKSYTLVNANPVYTIERWNILVRIDDKEIVYGDENPELTYTLWDGNNPSVPVEGVELSGQVLEVRSGSELVETPKNAGTYRIILTQEVTVGENYELASQEGVFVIRPATVTVTVSQDIGKATEDSAGFVYGELISASRFGDVLTYEGFCYGEDISVVQANPIYSVEGFELGDASARPGVGTYAVSVNPDSFVSPNYVFETVDGLLTINKAELRIKVNYIDQKSILYRTYGDELVIDYDGFRYEDNKNSVGTFTEPVPIESYTAAISPETPAGSAQHELRFHLDVQDLRNYNIVDVGDAYAYYVVVNQADLEVYIRPDGQERFVYTYGDEPAQNSFLVEYTGFKNNDADDLASIRPTLNFRKSVGDGPQFGESDIYFADSDLLRFSNYLVRYSAADFEVLPRELEVGFQREIRAMQTVTDGVATMPALTPYMYLMPVIEDEENPPQITNVEIRWGFYALADVYVRNFAYEDNMTLLKTGKFGEDKTTTVIVDDQQRNAGYVETGFFDHSVVADPVKGTIRLADVSLANTENRNYTFRYVESQFTLYTVVTEIRGDDDNTFLTTDGSSFDNIEEVLRLRMFNGAGEYYIAQNGLAGLTIGTPVFEGDKVNRNGSVPVSFSTTYEIFTSEAITNVPTHLTADETISTTFAIDRSQSNPTVSANIPVRYRFTTEKITGEIDAATVLDAYNQASATLRYGKEGETSVFDRIKTSVTFPRFNGNSLELIINGNVAGTQKLSLDVRSNGSIYVNIVEGGVLSEILAGGFDLFNGVPHQLTVYLDKQYNILYLLVGTNAYVLELGNSYTPVEQSINGITVEGGLATVSYYELAIQPYVDNFATLALPFFRQPGSVDVVQSAMMIYTQGNSYLMDKVSNYFYPSNPRNGQQFKYYVDGVMYNPDNNLTLDVGVHQLELLIYDDKDNLISSVIRYAVITNASQTSIATVDGQEYSLSTGNAATMASFTYLAPDAGSTYADASDSMDPDVDIAAKTMDIVPMASDTEAIENPMSAELSLQYTQAKVYKSKTVTTETPNPEEPDKPDIETQTYYYYDYRTGVGATETLITLRSDDSGNNSIVLRIGFTRMGYAGVIEENTYQAQATVTTELILKIDGTTYTRTISTYSDTNPASGGIAWHKLGDDERMNIGLYRNDDARSGMSNASFVLSIGKNGEPATVVVVDRQLTFGTRQLTDSQITNLLRNTKGKVTIRSEDTLIKVIDYVVDQYAGVKPGLLVDSRGYVGGWKEYVEVAERATLANATQTTAYYNYNAIGLRFSYTDSDALGERFRFYLASDRDIAGGLSGKGAYLSYVMEDNGDGTRSGSLYFSFYNGSTLYARQLIASGLVFAEGIHTVSVKFNATPKVANYAISGIINNPSGQSVSYCEAEITVDGVVYGKKGLYPYFDSTQYWVNAQGGTSTTVGSRNATYLPVFKQSSVVVSEGAMLMIYDYSCGLNTWGMVGTAEGEQLPDVTI